MLYRVRRGDFDLDLDFDLVFCEAVTDTGVGSWSNQVVSALRCARTGRGDRRAVRQAARSCKLTTGLPSHLAPMAIAFACSGGFPEAFRQWIYPSVVPATHRLVQLLSKNRMTGHSVLHYCRWFMSVLSMTLQSASISA